MACSYWLEKIRNKGKIAIIFAIVFLTSLKVIHEVQFNLSNLFSKQGFLTISQEELEAIRFIRSNTEKDAIVMIDPNISLHDTCYYMSFMVDRSLYLCGKGILNDHGSDTKEGESVQNVVFNSIDTAKIASVLNRRVDYIYLRSSTKIRDTETQYFLKQVFFNDTITILKVSKKELMEKI